MSRTNQKTRVANLALVLLLAAGAIGCGGDDSTTSPSAPSAASQCPDADPSETGPCGPTYVLPSWGDAGGWTNERYCGTIQLADIDGDGKAELLGRAPSGLVTYAFDVETGHWMPLTSSSGGLALTLTGFANPPPQGWGNTPSTDWTLPQYFSTIQTAHLGPGKGRQLVARSAAGIVVYDFVPGNGWMQLTNTGPMADGDCFTNGNCWNSDPSYYSSIHLGDIDGDGQDELLGRGGDGEEVYCWTGQGWTQLATPGDLSDANSFDSPAYYETIQLADVDGDGRKELMLRSIQGIHGFKFNGAGGCATGAWTDLTDGDDLTPFCDLNSSPQACQSTSYCAPDGTCANQDPSYYSTIQFADIDGEKGDELLGRLADGLRAYKWNGSDWSPLSTNTTFTDQAGWKGAQYYATIHTAKLEGGDTAQVVARDAAGIFEASYSGGAWSALEQSTSLTLEDDPWAMSASYYRTIQSGDVDGDGKDDLIGRGPYGLRTWFFDRGGSGAWASYLPYGYPPFPTTGQQHGLVVLTTVAKNLPQSCSPLLQSDPSVRSRYDGTDQGITLPQLQAFDACLQGADGCNCAGDAPPFARCTPPAQSGVSDADWKAVCNQILEEVNAAENVLTVFGHIRNIQTSLFISDNVTLPAIVSDLNLQEAGSNPSGSFALLDVFADMLEAAGSIAGIFDPAAGAGLSVAGDIMTSLISGVPSLADTLNTTYEQLQVDLANRVNDTQKAFAANLNWVLGDQALLTAVGELGSSKGAWQKVDELGMESIGRYGFALWVYQTLLPQYWQQEQITACSSPTDPENPGCNLSMCEPPSPAPYITAYAPGGVSFIALLPPDSQTCISCLSRSCPNCSEDCFWTLLPSAGAVNMVFGTLSPPCAYVPGNANTVWTWPDCTLGISSASGRPIFTNRGGWKFKTVSGNPSIP